MARTHEDILDELLVLQCQAGSREAFQKLVERWQPRLAGFAARLTADREASRDLVQDAWIAIVRGLGRLDDPARFRTWAYRIVANRCADWIRRRSVRRTAAGELRTSAQNVQDAANPPESEDDTMHLRAAMRRLPGEQRNVLSLFYLDELSVADVARVLSIPPGTVKSRLHHAREALRAALERGSS